jgi:hypothetical protein
MALQEIEIQTPTEQNFVVPYGKRNITFDLRYNSYDGYWFIDLSESGTQLLNGARLTIQSNAIFDSLKLGKLYLIDKLAGLTTVPIVKTDLGIRTILTRDF